MATMDIFEGDAFTIVELTRALENIPYKPALLSGSNLFSPRGVRSRTVVIESRDGTLSLIPFSERGSAYEQQVPDRREMRAFVCHQFKKQDVLWASEIQSVRDFGSESATQQVQTEVAYRLRKLRQDAETTFEYPLLNGIQGLVKDPKDHATVVNYFTEFGISPAGEIDFDLDNASPASGALRKRCQALIESVEDSMGGLSAGAVQVRAECGSAFFADLVARNLAEDHLIVRRARRDHEQDHARRGKVGNETFKRVMGVQLATKRARLLDEPGNPVGFPVRDRDLEPLLRHVERQRAPHGAKPVNADLCLGHLCAFSRYPGISLLQTWTCASASAGSGLAADKVERAHEQKNRTPDQRGMAFPEQHDAPPDAREERDESAEIHENAAGVADQVEIDQAFDHARRDEDDDGVFGRMEE